MACHAAKAVRRPRGFRRFFGNSTRLAVRRRHSAGAALAARHAFEDVESGFMNGAPHERPTSSAADPCFRDDFERPGLAPQPRCPKPLRTATTDARFRAAERPPLVRAGLPNGTQAWPRRKPSEAMPLAPPCEDTAAGRLGGPRRDVHKRTPDPPKAGFDFQTSPLAARRQTTACVVAGCDVKTCAWKTLVLRAAASSARRLARLQDVTQAFLNSL